MSFMDKKQSLDIRHLHGASKLVSCTSQSNICNTVAMKSVSQIKMLNPSLFDTTSDVATGACLTGYSLKLYLIHKAHAASKVPSALSITVTDLVGLWRLREVVQNFWAF